MERKQKQVFIPQAIASLGFADIADRYRATAERVNLYSRTRGANRFEALATCLAIMRDDPELHARVPDPAPLWEFVRSGRPLSHESFRDYAAARPSAFVSLVLHWSAESNKRITAEIAAGRPFPGAAECIAALTQFARVMVVSATPREALRAEWSGAGLLEHVDEVAGQERGPKKAQLAEARAAGFAGDSCLVIGDAPGDHAAAEANDMRFFPVIPGREQACWEELLETGIERFRRGGFAGTYQNKLLTDFYAALDVRVGHGGSPT
jgi:phosphoglycolate phosphatase-like HAD superfamily hydrolase